MLSCSHKKIPKHTRNILKGIDHFCSSTNKFSENLVGNLLNHDFYGRPNRKGTSEKVVLFSWFKMFRTEVHVQVHLPRDIFGPSFRFSIRSEWD